MSWMQRALESGEVEEMAGSMAKYAKDKPEKPFCEVRVQGLGRGGEGQGVFTMTKPHSKVRAKMSPEAQVRSAEKAQQLKTSLASGEDL